ncbi:hypothetical protein FHG87_014236 [Trinorchestia longiramus]|nr:hypothetical protein FHG87_014236 [Trinorchestia longiramus]
MGNSLIETHSFPEKNDFLCLINVFSATTDCVEPFTNCEELETHHELESLDFNFSMLQSNIERMSERETERERREREREEREREKREERERARERERERERNPRFSNELSEAMVSNYRSK